MGPDVALSRMCPIASYPSEDVTYGIVSTVMGSDSCLEAYSVL